MIESLSDEVSAALSEVPELGRILKRRADDMLAYLLRPTRHQQRADEAINGRLDHLRGSARVRNLTHYIARSLLEAGGFIPRLRPQLRGAG